MEKKLKIIIAFFITLFTVACSTKKDAFLNRSFHSVTTKYNVLYNGNLALESGLSQLNDNYSDNFWERLPIEPLKVEVLALPGMKMEKDKSPKEFERAEEKAVKAIQTHSMLIARQERNKQIDDAYLLLGKARYYSKRFVPALEAFNFVILKYPNASLINETKIWQAKTLVRLQNEEQAIENLKYLFKNKNLSKQIKEQAHTAIAMAYVKTDSLQQVINHLNKAVLTNYNKEQTARNLFILGQIYREQNKIDSSNMAFQKIIDVKKFPYKYRIHAQIEKAKNITNKVEALSTIETLKKLIKDRDNRPYLDQLYYQAGVIEHDKDKAINYFKKSLQHSIKPNFQKELTYQAIGNLFFDKADFLTAGAYYDSILQITKNENAKRVRSVKRRRKNLDEVIFYEKISKVNDSILKIAAMDEESQKAFFTSYIEKLKASEKTKQQTNSGSAFYKTNNNQIATSNQGKWYFYNAQTVGFGTQEFKRIWGNRPLEDNWRLSEKTQLNLATTKTVTTQEQANNNEALELSYYLNKIPTTQHQIDSIAAERNNAYFKLGVIYKEQFKELDLAVDKLEKLLTYKPSKNILLPAKYHLYKIYLTKDKAKALDLKNDIVNNYSDSKYAKIITNPKEMLVNKDDKNSPEKVYVEAFYDYKDEDFDSAIKRTSAAISKYEGQPIVAKFELLRAYAIGKKEGLKAFKEALEFVAMNYPNTEEGKKALEVITTIKTKI
ncbi:type IX secretion system periplasmic lipoprotein PorW/SprE [Lutibacter sp.]